MSVIEIIPPTKLDTQARLREATVTVGMVTAALAAVGEHNVSLASNRRVQVTKMIQAALNWRSSRDVEQ